ncbi:MAG: DUF4143 domain-containing protein [Deltaproteobacteria bacterium]|nr:DUF4143 domain-containing protein [Deltaproteobacteria bacterium]
MICTLPSALVNHISNRTFVNVFTVIVLLVKARVINKVYNSTGAGLPLATGASTKHFKSIFLDVGLAQRLLGVEYNDWVIRNSILDSHRGAVAEQFIGQELLHRFGDHEDPQLYYWHRQSNGSQAEVDYLYEAHNNALPIEVKSASIGHLRSMQQYLKTYKQAKYGVKCSLAPLTRQSKIINIPLYAIEKTKSITDELE